MLGARLARARGLRRLHGLVDQAGEADTALDGSIELEMQLGDLAGGEPVRELAAQETGGARKSPAGLLGLGSRSEGGEEHLGVRLVARELDSGERHQAHARIANLEPDQLGEAALDLLGDAGASGRAHAGGAAAASGDRARDLDDLEHLDLVTDLDVVEVLDRQAALEAGL